MADQGITLGDTPRSDGLDEAVFEELRANFRGELLRSRDDGYHVARAVFNGMIDRRPALIARCAGVADVIAAVNFARENDLQVAVRGGGHSVPGYAVVEGASSWTSRR
jgi:FAD/FMN-containing dehydrogenase